VITSDRGLCGAFNANIFRFLETEIDHARKNEDELEFVLLGVKALRYFQRRRIPFKKEFSTLLTNFNFIECAHLVNYLQDQFLNGDFKSVDVISYDFISSSRQQIRLQTILPLKIDQLEDQQKPVKIIFEPNAAAIFKKIVPLLIQNLVYRIVLNSLASEHSARMVAMDLATRNAAEMINTLTLILNKTRQALITKELLEIMTATEALMK